MMEKMYHKRLFPHYALSSLLILLILAVTGCASVPMEAPASISTQGAGYRFDQNGWTYLHIEGEAAERGFQHGYLLAQELKEILRSVQFLTYRDTGMTWEYFVRSAEEMFVPHRDAEVLDEIKGIAEGARAAGMDTTWQEVLAWNGYSELTDYWWPTVQGKTYSEMKPDEQGHCSAFVATGSYTTDGKIVMAHNSWEVYQIGQFFNLILDIVPAKGHRIFMQSAPGYVDSFTDFFVTDAGIMGTETTIGAFGPYDPDEVPEFCRVRMAMQYADTLDQFVERMKKQNNGGYANSWLLADTNTGEILRFELGLKFAKVDRTKDGYFIGFNAPEDPRIRNLECGSTGYFDIRTPAGARRVRLAELMAEYRGRIDVPIGQRILADHYDVYLQKENPGSRTVEGRYELDKFEYWAARTPYIPKGAVDGKVMDSEQAKQMSFSARWGSSSGMPFDASAFLAEHTQYGDLLGYLKDRPSQPWTVFTAGQK